MLKLTFHQTKAEAMVRVAATVVFDTLAKAGFPSVPLSQLADHPQYGFTASASRTPIGPKFVRITDLHDAGIDWQTVPFCNCKEPEKYLLHPNDLLFARTGATTGKTVLVSDPPRAVFASYLIRVRPKPGILPEYLYSFFQSDAYWFQISDSKEGSAQPNVNGQKLMDVTVPFADAQMQGSIARFLGAVRARQQGSDEPLPDLSPPLDQQRRIVSRIEKLTAKVEEAAGLRHRTAAEVDGLLGSWLRQVFGRLFENPACEKVELGEVALFNTGYAFKSADYRPEGMLVFRVSNITPEGGVDLADSVFLDSSLAPRYKDYELADGDILMVMVGGSVGKIGMVPSTVLPALMNQNMWRVAPADESKLDRRYLFYFLKFVNRDLGIGLTSSTHGHLTQGSYKQRLIPLPSVQEQKRVVAHVDDIQAKVDALKKLQFETAVVLDALMPSILDKAFRGELVPTESGTSQVQGFKHSVE